MYPILDNFILKNDKFTNKYLIRQDSLSIISLQKLKCQRIGQRQQSD